MLKANRFLTLVKREILQGSRGKALFVGRTLLAAIPITLMLWGLEQGFFSPQYFSDDRLPYLASQYFALVSVFICCGSVLLGCGMAIRSIRAEERQETLGLLLLSCLGPTEIILAKIVAIVASLGMMFGALLPVLAVIGTCGGLEYSWLAALGLLGLLLGVFGAATGLLSAVHFRSTLGAAFGCGVFWVLGTIAFAPLDAVEHSSFASPSVLSTFSPYSLVWNVANQGLRDASPVPGAFALIATSLLLIWLTSLRLPRLGPRRPSAGLRGLFERLDSLFERINWKGIRFERKRKSPWEVGPVYWLALTTGGTGIARYTLRLALGLFIVAFFLGTYSLVEWNSFGPLLWGFQLCLFMIGGILGSQSIGGERANKTFLALLTTSLSAEDILGGKARAGVRLIGLVSVPFVLLILGLSQVRGSSGYTSHAYYDRRFLNDTFDVCLVIAAGLALGVAAFFTAQFLSLYFKSSMRAWIGTASVFAVLAAVLAKVFAEDTIVFLSTLIAAWAFLGVVSFRLSVNLFSRFTGRSIDG
jgi:ABC-type transport system involved in multi-copper enzyme maturation permease subunit